MNRVPPEPEVRDWQLERYLLAELPAEETKAVREALERDEGLRERLAALERSNREILLERPPRVVAAAIRARASSPPPEKARRPSASPWGYRPAVVGALSLAAAIAGILVVPWRRDQPPPSDVTRVKGVEPHLLLYRRTPTMEQERLPAGAAARAGDVVQVAYQAAGRKYGVVVSVDGHGLVTRHLPSSGREAARLETGKVRPLAGAYQLDDTPGFERFHLVTANEPFPVDMVVGAVQRAQGGDDPRLDLPPSFDQFSFVLKKERSR